MRTFVRTVFLAASLSAVSVVTTPAHAQTIHATLIGYQEVPAISTGAAGDFRAKLDKFGVGKSTRPGSMSTRTFLVAAVRGASLVSRARSLESLGLQRYQIGMLNKEEP